MMSEQIVEVILAELKIKYRCVADTYSYTKKLSECMAAEDRSGAKEALAARALELEKASDCDIRIEKLLYNEKYAHLTKFLRLLRGEKNELSEMTELTEVVDIIEKMQAVWRRAVDIDKDLSRRIIGKDSYYK